MSLKRITISIDEKYLEFMTDKAARAGVSRSAYMSELIAKAIEMEAIHDGEDAMLPIIKETIVFQLNRFYENLENLMIRTYMEANVARRTSEINLLYASLDISPEQVHKTRLKSRKSAFEDLMEDLKEYKEWRIILNRAIQSADESDVDLEKEVEKITREIALADLEEIDDSDDSDISVF